MNHLFVSPELAQKLRSIGFDYPCLRYYSSTKSRLFIMTNVKSFDGTKNEDLAPYRLAAPIYQQVTDWLREKQGIEFYIVPNLNLDNKSIVKKSAGYRYNFYNKVGDNYFTVHNELSVTYSTYYEAMIKAIEKAIEFIKTQAG